MTADAQVETHVTECYALIEKALPATFYAAAPLHTRVRLLAHSWRRHVEVNAELEAERDAYHLLVSQIAEDLGLVERALVDVCQRATKDNIDQRMALLELRSLRERLTSTSDTVA